MPPKRARLIQYTNARSAAVQKAVKTASDHFLLASAFEHLGTASNLKLIVVATGAGCLGSLVMQSVVGHDLLLLLILQHMLHDTCPSVSGFAGKNFCSNFGNGSFLLSPINSSVKIWHSVRACFGKGLFLLSPTSPQQRSILQLRFGTLSEHTLVRVHFF